jgi:hypothetical protein
LLPRSGTPPQAAVQRTAKATACDVHAHGAALVKVSVTTMQL